MTMKMKYCVRTETERSVLAAIANIRAGGSRCEAMKTFARRYGGYQKQDMLFLEAECTKIVRATDASQMRRLHTWMMSIKTGEHTALPRGFSFQGNFDTAMEAA